jgi:hypothetical protein
MATHFLLVKHTQFEVLSLSHFTLWLMQGICISYFYILADSFKALRFGVVSSSLISIF